MLKPQVSKLNDLLESITKEETTCLNKAEIMMKSESDEKLGYYYSGRAASLMEVKFIVQEMLKIS